MITVVVGSTRPAKVDGTRDALEAIARIDARFAGCRLQAHDLTAIAPRMPMSLEEILDGARMRASALIDRQNPRTSNPRTSNPRTSNPRTSNPGTSNSGTSKFRNLGTLCVGLEGGLHRLPTPDADWSLQTWAAVTDGERWGLGAGPSIALPPSVAAPVVGGEELGEVIDRLAAAEVRGTRGAWGVLTADLIGRRDAFRLAVIAAMAPFYNPLET